MRHYRIQLTGGPLGAAIAAAGGVCYVATSGGARKVTLYNKDGAVVTNPVSLVNGIIDFYTADTVAKVDLFGQAPTGAPFIKKNVYPSGDNSLAIPASTVGPATLVIPFSYADGTAASETSTGFIVPAKAAVLPMPIIEVSALDSGITIDVGTLSTDSGDADGYVDGVSLTTAVAAKATLLNSGVTMGVLLYVQDSANAGDKAPEANVSMSGKQITYTLSSGADTAEGFIRLPMMLSVNAL